MELDEALSGGLDHPLGGEGEERAELDSAAKDEALAAGLDNPLRARGRYECRMCNEPIPLGGAIWPLEANARHRRTWVHIRCAAKVLGSPLVPPPCKHYVRSGFCVFGSTCFFNHPPDITPRDGPEPFSEEDSQRQGAVRRLAGKGASNPRSRFGCRNRVRNHHRAAALRRWLVATYGLPLLAAGTGVLEIGGGKGEISFQLVKINGVQATNVDPRMGRLDRYRKAWQWGFYTRNRAYEQCDVRARTPTAVPAEAEPRLIRAFFEMHNLRAPVRAAARREAAFAAASGAEDVPVEAEPERAALPRFLLDDRSWEAQRERAEHYRWTAKGLIQLPRNAQTQERAAGAASEAEADVCSPCGCCETDDDVDGAAHGGEDDEADEDDAADADRPEQVTTREEAQRILEGVSMVVSMHGDAAVDHALEFAIQRNVPFALVPCCVYRELSPWRDDDVRSYEELLEHLEARARRAGVPVARTTLHFEGKNQVLHTRPLFLPMPAPAALPVEGPTAQSP